MSTTDTQSLDFKVNECVNYFKSIHKTDEVVLVYFVNANFHVLIFINLIYLDIIKGISILFHIKKPG